SEDLSLHATRTELVGLAHILPVLDGLRRLPAEIADGRSGKRNSFESANPGAFVRNGFDNAVSGLDAVLCQGALPEESRKENRSGEVGDCSLHRWLVPFHWSSRVESHEQSADRFFYVSATTQTRLAARALVAKPVSAPSERDTISKRLLMQLRG